MTNPQTTGAAKQPLSKKQIRELVLLAREAYGMEFPPPAVDFDGWRHQHCMMSVERGGLTQCANEDYLPLKAHFLDLIGKHEQAEDCRIRHEMEPRQWALARLQHECNQAADVLPSAWNYAAGFVRNKRGLSIDDADSKTIWHAIYVVRRRAAQIRKKGAQNEIRRLP